MIKSEEYKRGYDAGYKQALLDALKQQQGQQLVWPHHGPPPARRTGIVK